ncbi:MAG: glycosyltransferase [Flavisolibacter sp.]|nr:glycosyltransferase [Flavisolibacter sp.]
MSDIKLSVIMPAYNAEKYIGEAITSVLEQSFAAFELIIINDGSTDKTKQIIKSFNDERIVLINQENQGLAAALNKGLAQAKAEYVVRFDADDICYKNRLERQYQFLSHNPDYLIVGSAVDYVDEHLNFIFTYHPPASNEDIQLIKQNMCPFIHSSVLFRKEAVIKYGYSIHAHTFEDHLLWLNVLNEGKAYNLQEPLIKVRLNPHSITIDERWRPRKFHAIKSRALKQKTITAEQGEQLKYIITKQNKKAIKEGAYFSLLAKKYLWNNYQPVKARQSLKRLAATNVFNWRVYFFFLLTFFPEKMLQRSYQLFKTR